MLPSRPAKIFRSRWAALLWAAGILWTAVDFIGFGEAKPSAQSEAAVVDVTGGEISNADIAVLHNMIGE